jgi:hypothetical protein
MRRRGAVAIPQLVSDALMIHVTQASTEPRTLSLINPTTVWSRNRQQRPSNKPESLLFTHGLPRRDLQLNGTPIRFATEGQQEKVLLHGG